MLKLLRFSTAMALAVALILSTLLPVSQIQAATVQLSVIAPAEVAPNTSFMVKVGIGQVTKLLQWNVTVEYDPDVLSVVGAEGDANSVTAGQIGSTTLPVDDWYYSHPGDTSVLYFEGLLNTPVTGQGYLAQIKFIPKAGIGSSSDISIILDETNLYDDLDNPITPQPVPGLVKIVATPKPSATTTPPKTTTPPPTTTPPKTTSPTTTPPKTTGAATGSPTSTASTTASPTASKTGTVTPSGTATIKAVATTPAETTPPAPSNTRITIAAPKNVPAGENFVIRIDISKAAKLGSCHFIMNFDPDILEVSEVTSGLIGTTGIDIKDWALVPDSEGQVEVNGTVSGSKVVSGSGYLAKVHCRMIGNSGDSSELTFAEINLYNVAGDPLDIEQTIPGTVSVEASKASIQAPKEVPVDGEFQVRINITELTDLASYNINLTYNSAAIEILSVDPGKVGSTEVPVDDWDDQPSDKKGTKTLSFKGALEDEQGVSGTGYLASIQCKVIGRLGQKCTFTFGAVELVDIEGNALLQSEPENGSVTIANPSFFASKLMLILVIAGGLIVLGLIVFFVLRFLRRRKAPRTRRPPSTPQSPYRGAPRTDAPEDIIDVMRDRVSQLPSRKDRKK
jgi:hypothetical protein